MSLYLEPNKSGKLLIKDGAHFVEYEKKGKVQTKPVPDSAREYAPGDASDGAALKFSMNGKGDVVVAYIDGKPRTKVSGYQVEKRPAPGQDRAAPRRGGPDRRQNQPTVSESQSPPEYGATAPYNFVRYPAPRPASDWDAPGTPAYSGSLVLKLENVTPLLVSGTGLQSDDTRNKADKDSPRRFRKVGGQFAVPGSSLKGAFRSLFEIVTGSAMSPVSRKAIAYRDVSDQDYYQSVMVDRLKREHGEAFASKSQAGFLVRKGKSLKIIPCAVAKIPQDLIFEHFKMGSDRDMWVKGYTKGKRKILPSAAEKYKHLLERFGNDATRLKTEVIVSPEQDWAPGEGKSGGQSNRRQNFLFHYAKAAFPEQRGKVAKRWQKVTNVEAWLVFSGWMTKKYTEFVFFNPQPDLAVSVERDVWEVFQDQLTPKQADHISTLEAYARKGLYPQGGIPIFYLQDDKGDVSEIGLTRLFRVTARHSPGALVKPPDNFEDMAQQVFGSTARAGRVSFSSAITVSHNGETDTRSTVLGQPHASCAAHYLFESDGDRHKQGRTGPGGRKNDANVLVGWNAPEASIRGWKRYWHRPGAEVPPPPNDNTETQAHLKPLKPGAVFETSIEFRDLTAIELGALLFAINPGKDGESPACHKLGMGKAIGWGSVRVEITGFEAWTPAKRYASIAGRFGAAPAPEISVAAARAAFESRLRQLFPDGTPHLDDLRMMLDFEHAAKHAKDWVSRTRPLELKEFKPKALLSSVKAVYEGRTGT